MLDHVQGCIL